MKSFRNTLCAIVLMMGMGMVGSGDAWAGENERFVVVSTKMFEYYCGIQGGPYGRKAILEMAYVNSPEGQALLGRMEKCQEAYEMGNPSAAPGKPGVLLEVLRNHSLAGTLWGEVRFLDGDRYIAVTKTLKTSGSADPAGGWGCIDYNGNVVIPFKYDNITGGDTNLNAIIFSKNVDDPEGKNQIQLCGLLRNDGSLALKAIYDTVWLLFDRWIVVCERNNRKNGWAIYDKDYNCKLSGLKKVEPFTYSYTRTDRKTKFFVITNETGKMALFNVVLRQITDFKFDGWMNERPYWLGTTGNSHEYNYTTIIDTRTWETLDSLPQSYWSHRYEEK